MRALTRFLWPGLVALAGGLIYASTLSNGFVLDDVPLIRDNPTLTAPARLPRLLLAPYWPEAQGGAASGLYRPVTIASYVLNRALTGPGPRGFHAVNVLLHATVCLLTWYAVRGASVHYGTAFLAGALFALHPLHTEAVAGIAGRAELLGALGVLLAWLAHRRALRSEAPRRWGLAAAGAGLGYLAALLSKENTILAPVLFWLDGRWEGIEPGASKVRAKGLYAVYAIALAAGLGLRLLALGGWGRPETLAFIDNPAAFETTVARLATAVWVQAMVAGLFVWPLHLSSDYSYDAIPVVASAADLRLWVGLLFLAGLILGFARAFQRSRPLVVGIGCWMLFWLPTSNLLFASGTILAERLAYLPSLGGCIVFGHVTAWLASDSPAFRIRGRLLRTTAVGFAAAACLALCGLRTVARNSDWRSNETLALHDARVRPRSAKLHAGAAIALHARGDLDGAEAAYRRALEIYPDYAQMHYNVGQLLAGRGNREQAIDHLERASILAPENPAPYKSLAMLLESAGRIEAALSAYEAGARADPRDHALRFNYGRCLAASGRAAEASRVLAELGRDASGTLEGRLGLALLREIEGSFEEAAALYRELLERPLPPAIRVNVEQRVKAIGPARGSPEAPR